MFEQPQPKKLSEKELKSIEQKISINRRQDPDNEDDFVPEEQHEVILEYLEKIGFVKESDIRKLEEQISDEDVRRIFKNKSIERKEIIAGIHALPVKTLKSLIYWLKKKPNGIKGFLPKVHDLNNELWFLYYTNDPKYGEIEKFKKNF